MAKDPKTNARLKEERHKKILRGALHTFAQKGFSGTKISDIARASAMSQGLIYHYYPSKSEIYTALITDAFQKMTEASIALEKHQGTARKKIIMATVRLLNSLERDSLTSLNYLLIANATISAATPKATQAIIAEKSALPYEVMERIFLTGQEEGSVKNYPAKELAIHFWSSIKGAAIHYATHKTIPSAPLFLETFLTISHGE